MAMTEFGEEEETEDRRRSIRRRSQSRRKEILAGFFLPRGILVVVRGRVNK